MTEQKLGGSGEEERNKATFGGFSYDWWGELLDLLSFPSVCFWLYPDSYLFSPQKTSVYQILL